MGTDNVSSHVHASSAPEMAEGFLRNIEVHVLVLSHCCMHEPHPSDIPQCILPATQAGQMALRYERECGARAHWLEEQKIAHSAILSKQDSPFRHLNTCMRT